MPGLLGNHHAIPTHPLAVECRCDASVDSHGPCGTCPQSLAHTPSNSFPCLCSVALEYSYSKEPVLEDHTPVSRTIFASTHGEYEVPRNLYSFPHRTGVVEMPIGAAVLRGIYTVPSAPLWRKFYGNLNRFGASFPSSSHFPSAFSPGSMSDQSLSY